MQEIKECPSFLKDEVIKILSIKKKNPPKIVFTTLGG